jgi:DNA-binding winged helix-turn-helix (wHTH) protein
MDRQDRHLYKFDSFLLDVNERLLLKDGNAVALAPKAFDILAHFVRNSGRLIDKDELMREVWHDVTVEETNISMNVSLLRKALGDQAREPRFIKTIPSWATASSRPCKQVRRGVMARKLKLIR